MRHVLLMLSMLIGAPSLMAQDADDLTKIKQVIALQQAQISEMKDMLEGEHRQRKECIRAIVNAVQDRTRFQKVVDATNSRFSGVRVWFEDAREFHDDGGYIKRNEAWGPQRQFKGFAWTCQDRGNFVQSGARMWYSSGNPTNGVVDRIRCKELNYSAGNQIQVSFDSEAVEAMLAACQ